MEREHRLPALVHPPPSYESGLVGLRWFDGAFVEDEEVVLKVGDARRKLNHYPFAPKSLDPEGELHAETLAGSTATFLSTGPAALDQDLEVQLLDADGLAVQIPYDGGSCTIEDDERVTVTFPTAEEIGSTPTQIDFWYAWGYVDVPDNAEVYTDWQSAAVEL